MKLVDDPEAATWSAQLGGGSEDFDWDAGNRTKNRKHHVEPADVEAMFLHTLLFVDRIVEPMHNEDRWLALGRDTSGRRLALVFTRRGPRLRPVSCRSMRVNERKLYEEAIQETE
jgi:uncharacterized DUF497 family protein